MLFGLLELLEGKVADGKILCCFGLHRPAASEKERENYYYPDMQISIW